MSTILEPTVGGLPFSGTDYNENLDRIENTFIDLGPLVISGLTLAIGSGLAVDVAAGVAVIGGRVTTSAPFAIGGLAPSTTNHLYQNMNGTGTSNTTGTQPANSVKLGTALTGAATVTSVDHSTNASGRQAKVRTENLIHGGGAGHPRAVDLADWHATNNEPNEVKGTLPAGTLPASVVHDNEASTWSVEPQIFAATPTATANRAVVNIGPNSWAGGGGGAFVGDPDGQLLAINGPSAFAGVLLEVQSNGAQRLRINPSGNILQIEGTASDVRLRIDLSTAQTANAVEIRDVAGTNIFTVGATGLAQTRIEDTTNNAVSYAWQAAHGSSAAAGAPGIGVGLELRVETATDDVLNTVATLEAVATTATAGATVGRLDLRVTDAGTLVTPLALATKKVAIEQAVLASANQGLLNLGSGGFTGAGGHFSGDANGTLLAGNAPSGYTGRLVDLQINASRKFSIDSAGAVTIHERVGFPTLRTDTWIAANDNVPATVTAAGALGLSFDPAFGTTATALQAAIAARVRQQAAGGATVLASSRNIFCSAPSPGANWTITNHADVALSQSTAAGVNVGMLAGTAPGSGNWNLYLNNALDSYLGSGQIGIGATIAAARLHISTVAAANIGEIIRGVASQSGNLIEWQSSASAVYGTISENGYWTTRKNSAPADAEIATGELALWFDSTNGAAKLMIKAKQADGTVVTGSVALA